MISLDNSENSEGDFGTTTTTTTTLGEAVFSYNIWDEVRATQRKWYCDGEMLDVTITCNDNVQVQAHKFILASVSKYFKTVFFGEMSKHENVVTSIPFSSNCVKFFLVRV